MRELKLTRPIAAGATCWWRGWCDADWELTKPLATMFVWAPIPEPFRAMGSLEFSKFLLAEAKVAVSPGIGFGEDGDGFVRFGLIENEHRVRQALRGIRHAMQIGATSHIAKAVGGRR